MNAIVTFFSGRVQDEEILSIMKSPIKCLGNWSDASLQDRDNVKRLKIQVEGRLTKRDRSNLPGKYKAWLYQHALLPRLIWPMMLYEVPSSKNRISREDHQPLSEKVARNSTQFLQCRPVCEE